MFIPIDDGKQLLNLDHATIAKCVSVPGGGQGEYSLTLEMVGGEKLTLYDQEARDALHLLLMDCDHSENRLRDQGITAHCRALWIFKAMNPEPEPEELTPNAHDHAGSQ